MIGLGSIPANTVPSYSAASCARPQPKAARTSSRIIMWVLFWLMACFYMIPITAIQGLIDVPKFTKDIPGLNTFVNAPVVKQLIEAVVPGEMFAWRYVLYAPRSTEHDVRCCSLHGSTCLARPRRHPFRLRCSVLTPEGCSKSDYLASGGYTT